MTDIDIAALIVRLRDRHRDQYPTPGSSTVFTQAADALEALQAELAEVREVKDGYYEAMAEWRDRAEKAALAEKAKHA